MKSSCKNHLRWYTATSTSMWYIEKYYMAWNDEVFMRTRETYFVSSSQTVNVIVVVRKMVFAGAVSGLSPWAHDAGRVMAAPQSSRYS